MNAKVHPIFEGVLQSMDRIPERPLQPRQPAFDESIPFDEFDDVMVKQILGNERLAKPIQDLLITLHQIDTTCSSFGADKAKVADALIPELVALREACRDAWKDL